MLRDDIIEPTSTNWGSPCFLISKKSGEWRFIIDYKKLNRITAPDCYPLPCIDQTLQRIGDSTYLSTFDLGSGYWQVPVMLEDQDKTAFVTGCSMYGFKVMHFGLNNAPDTFQMDNDNDLESPSR